MRLTYAIAMLGVLSRFLNNRVQTMVHFLSESIKRQKQVSFTASLLLWGKSLSDKIWRYPSVSIKYDIDDAQ